MTFYFFPLESVSLPHSYFKPGKEFDGLISTNSNEVPRGWEDVHALEYLCPISLWIQLLSNSFMIGGPHGALFLFPLALSFLHNVPSSPWPAMSNQHLKIAFTFCSTCSFFWYCAFIKSSSQWVPVYKLAFFFVLRIWVLWGRPACIILFAP